MRVKESPKDGFVRTLLRCSHGGVITTGPDATHPPTIFQNSGGGGGGGGGGGQLGGVQLGVGRGGGVPPGGRGGVPAGGRGGGLAGGHGGVQPGVRGGGG